MNRNKKILIPLLILTFILSSFITAFARVKKGTPPTAPSSISASGVTTSEVTLTWTTSQGATGYKVFMATPND